jgi:hypothetical protein
MIFITIADLMYSVPRFCMAAALCLFGCLRVFGERQQLELQWDMVAGTNANPRLFPVRDASGVYVVEQRFEGAIIKRLDGAGKLLWELPFSNPFVSILRENEQGLLVAVEENYLAIITPEGQIGWRSGVFGIRSHEIVALKDDTFLTFRSATESDTTGNPVGTTYILSRFNVEGNLLWSTNLYSGSSRELRGISSGVVLPNGDYLLVGSIGTYPGSDPMASPVFECWIVRIAATCELVWDKTINLGSDSSGAAHANLRPDGDVLFLSDEGSRNSDSSWNQKPVFVRLTPEGDVVWQRPLPAEFAFPGVSISQLDVLADGSIIGSGTTHRGVRTKDRAWVFRASSEGELLWDVGLDGVLASYALSAREEIYIAREVASGKPFRTSRTVAKFAPETIVSLPGEFALRLISPCMRFFPLERFHLQLIGAANKMYAIEGTQDFVNWTEITTNKSGIVMLTGITNRLAAFRVREF